jgi:hypothetical protein
VGPIDILGFDACNMSEWEVALAMQPYATFMTSTETFVGAEGFQYKGIIEGMAADLSPRDLAVRTAQEEVEIGEEYTASALDLAYADEMAAAMDAIAVLALSDPNALAESLAARDAARSVETSYEDWYIDLGSFFDELEKQAPDDGESRWLATAGSARAAMEQIVVAHFGIESGRIDFTWTSGIYGMFDSRDADYLEDYAKGSAAVWAEVTHWDELLYAWAEID